MSKAIHTLVTCVEIISVFFIIILLAHGSLNTIFNRSNCKLVQCKILDFVVLSSEDNWAGSGKRACCKLWIDSQPVVVSVPQPNSCDIIRITHKAEAYGGDSSCSSSFGVKIACHVLHSVLLKF